MVRVTVVVPALNEARYISRCLDHLLAQDYPSHLVDIIVVDGGSTDGTQDLVRAYAARCPRVRLLHNPARRVGAAMNIGVAHALGDIIVRVDAHAFVAPDYVRQCVHYLMSTDADAVGGVLRPVGDTPTGRVIAAVMSHPLGGGPARFRHARRPMWVDTVYLGAWRRETLLEMGGFDETLEANEDYEFFYRLRQAGGRILCHPAIRSSTAARSTLKALWHQYVRYGRGKARMLRLHPRSLRARQIPAPALVAGVFILGSAGIVCLAARVALVFILGLYAVIIGSAAADVARRLGWTRWAHIWITFWVMHWGWGVGFWSGLFSPGKRRRMSM